MATEIQRDRLVADLSAMVAIRSESPWEGEARPGFREREMADWLLAQMASLGLETGEAEVAPGRPNIWGRRKGSGGGPTLMLAAHMDTVGVDGYLGDPFAPRVEDGKLYGRGSCDMKGPIAAILETVRVLQNTELRGDLLVLLVVDEEYAMAGSVHAGRHGPSADFAVVAEPTRLAVCPKHKGHYCGRLVVRGQAAHTSMPEKGRSAILDMSAVIQAFHAYNDRLQARQSHPMCGTGRSTVSTIKGGTSVSSVADHCEIEFDRRSLPGETDELLTREFERVLDEVREQRPGLIAEIGAYSLNIPALDTALDAPITKASVRAVEAVLGETAKVESFPGGTDAPNLKIPGVILGPGDLAQAHTINEWIELDQLPKAVAIYRHLAIDLLG